ncbi:MAG: type ISP restriction/modification enzyme [Terracidiphilus sp.]
MSKLSLKPTNAPVKAYYAALQRFARGHFDNEGNIRGAFEDLLKKCARQFDWTLVPEYPIPRKDGRPLSVDAALLDAFNLPRGYWEAKDTKDTLEVEMKKKFEAGYPRSNILFQRPDRALLFQDGHIAFHDSIEDPNNLIQVLQLFFEWRQPDHDSWDRAVSDFSDRIPEIARGAMKLIDEERRTNRAFVERFAAFAELCRESINPDLKDEAVEEMLVQHLLTERIFRRIFDNPEFTRRNVIAAEIEKVIDSLTKRHFSRDSFLRDLDPFYKAIEQAASTVEDYSEKQRFLNTVYERFFQSFNRKQADTHGIVYTPQPIVDFMVRSVEALLKAEFGRSLSDKDVHILDPFVGTGNFITRIMREIKTSHLPQKYKEELHCNEVMLLPYYIASMNIEHAYLDRTDAYEPFEGICLVDTFELAEPKQAGFEFMTEGNTERIRRQKKAPIFVVTGNPPYNVGQTNENDQNKNRKYKHMDQRVRETYSRASNATLLSKLNDPYVKAFRWASDRIRPGGVVAFVSNDSFVDQTAFDGMRHYIEHEFDRIYVLDLGGNVRKNPKLSGTTHNVFGIQVGVCITLLIRSSNHDTAQRGKIFYASTADEWRKEQKYRQLSDWENLESVKWREITPDSGHTWITEGLSESFKSFLGMASLKGGNQIFDRHCLGVSTNRDATVYSYHRGDLERKVKEFIHHFCDEVARFRREGHPKDIDGFVNYDKLQWSRNLKRHLKSQDHPRFSQQSIKKSLYRPFNSRLLYLQDVLVDEPAQSPNFFSGENKVICVPPIGARTKPWAFATSLIPNLNLMSIDAAQCFPFYTYDEDGSNRRDNITDWAQTEFRSRYGQKSISKLDIFHYTYALLHHPEYRTRYAANLKRELPRIPFAPDFADYARIGADLMKLHLEYEQQREYPLERRETGKLDWCVDKMALSKDKTQLKYNDFLTLSGIPPEVYEYRLGNRSALEWVIDQYRVSTDKRSGIVNDPNREDDPEYIVRLIGQVVTVSLETVRLVRELSALTLLPGRD